jgi:hypothetical protein
MSLKRVLHMTGIVCAVLLITVFSFSPGFAAALPDDTDPPDAEVDDDLPKTSSDFCADRDLEHPVGARLAETFGAEYGFVMEWFCDREMGFGQVMLALTTAQVSDGDAAGLLARRAEGEGWGQIWQDLALIGRDRPKTNGQNGNGEPLEDGGPPDNRGRPESTGRPEDPGSPEDLDRANGVGPGDNRGLHLGHFKDKDR